MVVAQKLTCQQNLHVCIRQRWCWRWRWQEPTCLPRQQGRQCTMITCGKTFRLNRNGWDCLFCWTIDPLAAYRFKWPKFCEPNWWLRKLKYEWREQWLMWQTRCEQIDCEDKIEIALNFTFVLGFFFWYTQQKTTISTHAVVTMLRLMINYSYEKRIITCLSTFRIHCVLFVCVCAGCVT